MGGSWAILDWQALRPFGLPPAAWIRPSQSWPLLPLLWIVRFVLGAMLSLFFGAHTATAVA